MPEFESQPTELDKELNNMLMQLGPDTPPAGFTARTMDSIRPKLVEEPFRIHWSDFVPAFVLAALGAAVLFVWLGAAGAHSMFENASSGVALDSFSEIQIVVIAGILGLLVVAYPLLKENRKRGSSWFFSMI